MKVYYILFDFNKIKKDLLKYYNQENYNKAYAHIKEVDGIVINETLEDHSNRSLSVLLYLLKDKKILAFLDSYEKEYQKLIYKLMFFNVFFHDYGKQNINFQHKKMKNKNYKEYTIFQNTLYQTLKNPNEKISEDDTNHSRFNNIILNNNLIKYLEEDIVEIVPKLNISKRRLTKKINKEINDISMLLVEKHHSGLEDINSKEDINNRILFEYLFKDDFSFIFELLHSVLINSDVLATKYFMEIEDLEKITIEDYLNRNLNNTNLRENLKTLEKKIEYNELIYKNKEFKNINTNILNSKIKNSKDLNELKYLNSKILKDKMDKTNDISFFKGKTGIGKTNLSFIIANEYFKEYKELNKLIYVLPLNTLIQQTKEELIKHIDIEEDNIKVINSIERESVKENNLEDSYFYENFNNNLILTSTVNFLQKLFNKSKKDISHLINLKNSLIIIDELQLINDNYFNLTYNYLKMLTKYLNCKIVILSATIPIPELSKKKYLNNKINYLIDRDVLETINKSNLLNRYKINLDYYTNLDYQESFSYLLNKKENNSILIVHNSINKLQKFYEEIKEIIPENYQVLFYNNNIISPQLNNVINKIKSNEEIIIFSTRKIETGVDVSFNQGIKFIDSFDNIEQFGGRINRYNKYEDSEIVILNDEFKFSGNQERESIIARQSNNFKIIQKYIKDIDLYYQNIFNKEEDKYIEMFEKSKHNKLNNIKLIEDYEKENFIIDFKIDSKEFKEIEEFLEKDFIKNIKEDNIENIREIYYYHKKTNSFGNKKYKKYFNCFQISGYVNKNSEFAKNELHKLELLNISFSKNIKDNHKIISLDNFYYDINLGLQFNKEIADIEDTMNI